ncbi:hypothetical protein [Reichenbachiella sp. MALMAid0571]|uniref:hypothetical protein n=1 Tax=Reichenbachiella sp. MALMAid0571 TaxID=3143939 RepID=UPI0032DED52F
MGFYTLLIFVSLLVLVVFLVVILTPIIKTQLKARKLGVNITLKEAHALSNIPELPNEFLNTAADLRKIDRNVYLGSLVDYHIAGGNLSKLKDGLERIKSSGKEVSFNTLLLLNLAKKDVQEAIDNIDKVYEIDVREVEENGIKVNYHGEFKIDFQDSFWVIPDLEEIKENLKNKIELALLSADTSDKGLEEFITQKYLNKSFWRDQSHAIILNQKIEIIN